MSRWQGLKALCSRTEKQIEILQSIEEHEKERKPCVIAGVWGTGKTLPLAYKAIQLSSEGKKVVFISNLDSDLNQDQTMFLKRKLELILNQIKIYPSSQ